MYSSHQSNDFLLKTATAPVTCNILFDEGAQRSFITQKLADKLEIKPTEKVSIQLSAFGDLSQKVQEVTISPILPQGNVPFSGEYNNIIENVTSSLMGTIRNIYAPLIYIVCVKRRRVQEVAYFHSPLKSFGFTFFLFQISNHEQLGNCCPIGTFYDAAENCKECSIGFYGKNCYAECICRDIERCDNKHGCVEPTTTYRFSTISKGKEDEDNVVFYIGGVGLLVIGFLIGMLLGLKNKCCYRKRASEEKDDEIIQYPAGEPIEMDSYEYIDEQHMTDQNQFTVPPSLPALRKCVQHLHNEASNNDYTYSIDGQKGNRMEDEGVLILMNRYKKQTFIDVNIKRLVLQLKQINKPMNAYIQTTLF
ncbi:unnamed protein product [Mytilus coruscus]|uniref:Uncharacterized protein n=1 Tax=Mytilus coruscus TaxID=42192 RepID=A0A6J8F0J7_MYTCO|nr:unnamed protein product [Mytilus coruscus]